MFGNADQNQNPAGQTTAPADVPAADVVASAPTAPTIPDPMVTPSTVTPASTSPTGIAQPEVGVNGVSMENTYQEPITQISSARAGDPSAVFTAAPAAADPPAQTADGQDLASIKQQALQSLEPLVGQLDLAPEEKYKTIMMLVQASDKPKMLEEAYQAASQITDEKTRAQALLDIVNEVNYFTQQNQAQQ